MGVLEMLEKVRSVGKCVGVGRSKGRCGGGMGVFENVGKVFGSVRV